MRVPPSGSIGGDNFAGVTFSDVADGRRILDDAFELLVECDLGDAAAFVLVFKNDGREVLELGYDRERHRFFINRQRSGRIEFDRDFANVLHTVEWVASGNRVRMRIFVDWSSVELFAEDGRVAMTDQVFPERPYTRVDCRVEGGRALIIEAKLWAMDSI